MVYQLKILSSKKESIIAVRQPDNLLETLHSHHYSLPSICGGNQSCGQCKIKVLEGDLKLTDAEIDMLSRKEINKDIRLACCHKINGYLKISLPEYNKINILTKSSEVDIELNPSIKRKIINPVNSSIEKQTDLLTILKENNTWFNCIKINLLNKLPNLSTERKTAAVVNQGEIIDFQRVDHTSGVYGFALDIGTTTVVMYLVNLLSGKEVDVISFANPQKEQGADVISRINYTQKNKEGLKNLQQKIINGLNTAIDKILKKNNIKKNNIYQISIVGNTIMLHFLLGVSAEKMAKSPYIPVFTEELNLDPGDLDLNINKNAVIKLHPSISSYIGADIVADITATDYENYRYSLLIDIGTNGEIVLFKDDKIYACSAAAGPAFEGAGIRYGSAGVPGAVAAFDENGYHTIADQPPHGICGSGLLDIVCYLLEKNYIDKNGAFNKKENLSKPKQKRLLQYKGKPAFIVVDSEETANSEALILTQKDIREFQLAKGAVAAGIEILIKKAGIQTSDIERLYLAGGFGNYINIENAKKVGLIPNMLTANAVKMGNGAGLGAKIYLLNLDKANEASETSTKIEYVELSKIKLFQKYFMDNMLFNMI
ncbi:ASKHA domain-containing protein [Halanaerobium hydrogeniformans]|uniref:ASKHA domain-containing protein n=1 Tax=Halanaerobium hydrogeniformans TaxID=656519 RepID=UPI00030CDFB3|nr:ASKHA domain-containing protein [Halanaerobium hydrogeniformans]